ncbi:hypothetical protein FNF31_01240 [Cafeteria roenbergensis]|uniref:Mitogen-activated protein kinase n=1 Tax=Cafeteria roenbergensis TaxID=33653 RepID=A0A5A8DW69_CAFRO|nr:hypothetical protein FNF31_01240 [Cafeteria roenbergensis]KAA0169469.1 hypothetical protein FNF28_02081 [Cafeteria roenbergensis]
MTFPLHLRGDPAAMAVEASHGRSFYQVKVSHETMYIDKRYQKLSYIGGGAYGFVCAATDTVSKRRVAIKKIRDVFRDLVDGKRILREIKLLRHLGGHQNIIWILDIMVYPNSTNFRDLYIVTDLMDTDLSHIISSRQTLSDSHIKYFLYQILRGLKYVHSAGVLHRDLKPQNVLVNANCELVVCDFGLARAIGRRVDEPSDESAAEAAAAGGEGDLTSYVVTRWYRAPELLCGAGMYDAAVDIWAVGCILAEILGRRAPFPGRNFNHMIQLIVDCLGSPTEESMWFIRSERVRRAIRKHADRKPVDFRRLYPHANPQALDLLRHMLVFDPSKRISVVEALAHPYLSDYHYPDDEPVAPSVVEFPFDKMGALSKAFLQAKMVEEMLSHAAEMKDKPPPGARVPVAAPAPADGAAAEGDAGADADADAAATAAGAASAATAAEDAKARAAAEAEEARKRKEEDAARARAAEAVAAQAERALADQRREEERRAALDAERRRSLMGAMGGMGGSDAKPQPVAADAMPQAAAPAPAPPLPASRPSGQGTSQPAHQHARPAVHGAHGVSADAAAGFDPSSGTGRLSGGLDGPLTASEVEAKINARVLASEVRTAEAVRQAIAEALKPVIERIERLEKAVDAVAGGRPQPAAAAAESGAGAGGVGFGQAASPGARVPPRIRSFHKDDHVRFPGVHEGGHKPYPTTPVPKPAGGHA